METLTLGENAQTVAFMPTEEGIAVEIVEDAAADITPTNARVQVINLTDADAEITLNDAAVTDSTETAPGDAVFAGTLKLEAPLYGGTLYTVFVYGEGETAFMETPLAVNLLSVPFEQVAPVVAATAEPIAPAATEEVAVVETPVQTIEAVPTTTPAGELVPLEQTPSGEGVAAATTPSSEVVPATEVSSEVVPGGATPVPPVVNQSTPVPPVQPATTLPGVAAEVVRGQVNLNDGVNIHCREYPSTDARSLGLIPNGTEIIVRGLAGPRDDVVGRSDAMRIEDLPDISAVVAADFTADNFDAAFLEALTLGDLWLDLDWPLENGSTFGCWGNALYILANYGGDLLNAPRAYLDLLDQEVIGITPYNVPGGPREVGPGGASALPPTPTAREDHILATVSVDSSSNLQLRRTPSVNGESLALVAGGSQLIVFEKTLVTPEGGVNVPTVPEWLFVEFTATDGVVWRGWVSAQYVTLSFRGRLYNLADVPTAETIQPGGPVGTGTDTTGAAPVAPQQPAASVPTGPVVEGHLLTDPSINLNLRDLPVTTGVVRDTVPHDTILEVIGRNGDGTWYEVIYHRTSSDVRGWVAAEFIDLFFQGQPYDPTRLPVTTGEPDTIGSAIPTATTTP